MADVLNKLGHDVHWFSSSFHHYKKEHRSLQNKDIAINDMYTIHLLKTKGYKRNISLQRIMNQRELSEKFNIKAESLKKPDVIIATMAPLQLSKSVVEFGEKNNIPTVIDIRDLWPEIYYEAFNGWKKKLIIPYVKYSEKRLISTLRKSTSIIGVTPGFLEYGLNLAKIQKRKYDDVFYTSYKQPDYNKYKNRFEDYWGQYGLKKDDFIVTFLGNFGRQFVLEPVIEAARKLSHIKGLKFVLCGTGESLDRIKSNTKDTENIIFPGWIEEKQIYSLLSNSDLGIAPYKNSINFTKNTPNKFGEYLSASLPILMSVDGIMEDLAEKYNCGRRYRTSEELAKYIIEFKNNSQKLCAMKKNAEQLYQDKFNAEEVYQKLSLHLTTIVKEVRSK